MKEEPDLTLRGRASVSRSLSPVSNRDTQILSPAVVKARGLRESRKLSWEGYENLIKNRNEEDYSSSLPSISPPAGAGAGTGAGGGYDSPPRRTSRFSSRSVSPVYSPSPSRGPSPDSAAAAANQSNSLSRGPLGVGGGRDSPPTTRRPSKRQSLQAAAVAVTPVAAASSGRLSAPPDLYAFPRSKSHVRFTRSLPKLPDELLGIQRSASPADHPDVGIPVGPVGTSPVPGFGHGHGRPSFVSHRPERGVNGERRAFFGDNYGYGDVLPTAPAQTQESEHPIKITFTPRVPGDEAWRDDDEINDPKAPVERLDGEGLAFKIPEYLENLRGTSQDGERPAALGARVSNIAGVQLVASHRRSTFIRAVEAVTGLGATVLAPSTEKITSKYVTTAAKKNSTVIVPVNAKQWLLQSLRMKDWELRELFDQMERIPQLAADHVREVRAEWESLEARAMKVPPEADMLLKDQQLLERTKSLLRRFVSVLSEDTVVEEEMQLQQPPTSRPPQESPDMSNGTNGVSDQGGGISVEEEFRQQQQQPEQKRESFVSSPVAEMRTTVSSPSPFGHRNDSIAADLYLRKPLIGKPLCPTCGRLDTTAPNTRIMGGMLPRESPYQSRGPSPVPRASLPSFIPFEDYVVRQSIVKPSGKSDQFKSTYSPLEKRWYTVLFPALQPGKREDVSLLSEWLCHATQRNGVEDADGHFKDVETAFVLHSIAFLEVVRQVRIHCEERGDMILHVWRQLLRIFNQVMHRAEPKVTTMEDEVKRVKELRDKDRIDHARTIKTVEELKKKLKETEENLEKVQLEIIRYKRCRLCLAGNMTPRTRENFVRKAMLKRFVGTNYAREKSRAELFQETLADSLGEARGDKDGDAETDQQGVGAGHETAAADRHKSESREKLGRDDSEKLQESTQAGGQIKPNTVISFLRAALLKRAQRPTLDEAANQQIQNQQNFFGVKALETPMEDKCIQTDDVEISEISQYARVLKRSASCPARLFWKEIYDPQKAERHKQWMIDNGMIPEKGDKVAGDDEEVEIVVASSAADEAASEGLGEGDATGDGKDPSKMKKQVNKLANETMDLLGLMGEELGDLKGEGASKLASLMKKWKKIARATSAFPMPKGGDGAEGGEDGDEAITEWEEGDEGEGDDESGVGKGKRRKSRKGRGRREGEDGEPQPGQSRRSVFDVAADVLKRSKRSTGKYTMGQTVELGKTVPLGFAKMMDISKPPKDIKFFNDRQLTKLITAVYVSKVEADSLDDAAGGDRQSSCEFVYDFMLNLYGLKRLAESAVWGLFKKINSLRTKKEIEKCHKARIFNRFCGMDESKYYSERELYLYLKVMTKGNSINGLFYPSELDDGISYVNCVWVESLASEPTLISYMGSQAVALEFIQKFVASHATMDKVSLEVKKITKSEKVKRIDFDELMEAIFERGAADTEVVNIPKAPQKGAPVVKAPLTTEQRLALEDLFIAGDANQDGVLTFPEFREIVQSANPKMSKQDALRIFRETLLLEPEGGDKISPAAFATVAHKHDITAPPEVIFDLLKKTWLQIQADVNQNKIKDDQAKKESNELRMKIVTMIESATDTNGAVQAFRDYVLKFCGQDEENEQEEEQPEEQEEEEEALEEKMPDELPEAIPEKEEEEEAQEEDDAQEPPTRRV